MSLYAVPVRAGRPPAQGRAWAHSLGGGRVVRSHRHGVWRVGVPDSMSARRGWHLRGALYGLYLRDGRAGISLSATFSKEVEGNGSSAAGALLEEGFADDWAEEEATETGATDGV